MKGCHPRINMNWNLEMEVVAHAREGDFHMQYILVVNTASEIKFKIADHR
jgi:hypothetical protein